MHAVRDIGKADDDQLTGIQAAATQLLDSYERYMGADLVEALCLWREAAQRQQKRRFATATVAPIRPEQAS